MICNEQDYVMTWFLNVIYHLINASSDIIFSVNLRNASSNINRWERNN